MTVVTLAEDLLVLACRDGTGRSRISGTRLETGLGGALLLDLAHRGRIMLVGAQVRVVDPGPTGDGLLDAALATIVAGSRPREPDHWVRVLARGARAAVEARLVAAGGWERAEHRVLGLVPVRRAQPVDDRVGHALADRLHDAVVLGHQPSPAIAGMVILALAVGLDRYLFPRSDRHAVRRRMAEIAGGHWVGDAVRQVVDADDAVMGIPVG